MGIQMKEEMGGSCVTYGWEKMHAGFCKGNLKNKDNLEE